MQKWRYPDAIARWDTTLATSARVEVALVALGPRTGARPGLVGQVGSAGFRAFAERMTGGNVEVDAIQKKTKSQVLSILATTALFLLAHYVVADGGSREVTCPIDRGPVTSNVLLRVFPVRIGERVGTGFTMEIDHRQYLVTAKHLLVGKLPSFVEIQIDDWIAIPAILVGMGKEKEDVLVLATDRQLSENFPVNQGIDGMIIGQSVRFLGYFPGVQTSPLPGYNHRGAPLVMGGVASGLHLDDDVGIGASIWIDGHNNRGFSGGPVVFQPMTARSLEECHWKIAGVITGYVEAPVEVETATGADTDTVAISNAGLLHAAPIRIVRDLIEKNPIGFVVE